MKKAIPFFLAALALTACEKEPDLNQLSSDLIVYTDYDQKCDFGNYVTFAIPDSILVLSNSSKPIYYSADDPRATAIIGAFTSEMEARGYTQSSDLQTADLGVQVSYVKNTNTIVSYASGNPYWWYGYGYYWPCSYWDPYYWGWGPYYGYPITYSYTVGSLIAEIVALKDADATTKKIPVVWTAYMAGIMSSNQLDLTRTLTGIYQAFEQSPYITAK